MSSPINAFRYFFITWILVLNVFLPGATTAESALSTKAIERLTSRIQEALDEQFDVAQHTDEWYPGATVSVSLPVGSQLSLATGYVDTDAKRPMPIGARMPAGSIGKTYVAAVALSLVTDGLLELDVPIDKWLGEADWFRRLPNHDAITLRHLLNHSSGIVDHVFDTGSGFRSYLKEQLRPSNLDRAFDPRELVEFVLDREPLFAAGQGFHYTDTGYILVGMIIESVSSHTYYEELNQRMLIPLGLAHTSPMDRRDIPGVVQGYAPQSHQLFGIPEQVLEDGVFVFHPSLEWTGGGLVSDSADLVRWAKALFEGRAIAPGVLDEMLTSVASPTEPPDELGRVFGYGLGVSIVKTDFGACYRHGGFYPGYNSFLGYFPDKNVAIAMQINTDNSDVETHFDAITKIVMDALDTR